MGIQGSEKTSFFAPSSIPKLEKKILQVPPASILFLCLLLTAFSVHFAYQKNQTEAQNKLDRMSRRFTQSVQQRMEVYVTTLFHTRSFISANPSFSRDEFKAFVSNLEIKNKYPGIQGIGYALQVDSNNLNEHVQQIRRQGVPDYKVWPEGKRDFYFSIVLLEPLDERNQNALGYDMYSEQVRRKAMEKARDTGEPVMTSQVTLVQETKADQQKGFLIYLPKYAPGAPIETVEQRRAALQGFIYSPFRSRDLFDEILQEENRNASQVIVNVYFGDEIRPDRLLYSPLAAALGPLPANPDPDSSQIEKLQINGQKWTLVIQPLNWKHGYLSSIPWALLVFGVLTSIIIYWFFLQAVRLSNSLQKSGDQIRLIADALPVLIAYVNLQGKYTFHNRTYREWFGEKPSPFQWKSAEEHSQVLSAQKTAVDIEIVHPELGARKVNRQLLPDVRHGEVVGFVVVMTDLTEEMLIRDRIAEEQRITEIISDVGLKVTSELSLDKVVQAITDSATKLTGAQFGAFFYNVQNAQGQNLTLYAISGVEREAFSKFPMPRNTKIFGPTFAGEGVVRYDDVTEHGNYGQNPPYNGMPAGHLPVRSYLAAPVKSRNGTVLGGLFFGHGEKGVFTERSEKLLEGIAAQAAVALDNAKLYEQAQQANRMKDEFLATLSHELRTPLNVIMGHAEILKSEDSPSEELALSVDAIFRNAQTQNQIINDLLDISAIITGKMSFHPIKLDAVEIVRTAIENIRLALDSKGIRLRFKQELDHMEIIGDSTRLQQVIWNLLSNAVKFTPREGEITVVLQLEGSKCVICVSDNGAGIEPEFVPFVFDRFRQEDSSFSRKYGGLGLGLSITRQLVEMHGGTIRVTSEGKGKGTTFTVSLPIASVHVEAESGSGSGSGSRASSSSSSSEKTGARQKEDLTGVRALVIDDEKDARDLIAQILQRIGAKVDLASSASEGLELLMRGKYDVIISDLGMPNEDGLQFIRKWRAYELEKNDFTPALVLTAYAQEDEKKRALSAGYQMHLSKPLQSQKLIHSILRLVDF